MQGSETLYYSMFGESEEYDKPDSNELHKVRQQYVYVICLLAVKSYDEKM